MSLAFCYVATWETISERTWVIIFWDNLDRDFWGSDLDVLFWRRDLDGDFWKVDLVSDFLKWLGRRFLREQFGRRFLLKLNSSKCLKFLQFQLMSFLLALGFDWCTCLNVGLLLLDYFAFLFESSFSSFSFSSFLQTDFSFIKAGNSFTLFFSSISFWIFFSKPKTYKTKNNFKTSTQHHSLA